MKKSWLWILLLLLIALALWGVKGTMNTATDLVGDVVDTAGDAANAVVDGAGDVVDGAADAAGDAAKAVVDGAGDMVGGAADAVGDAANAVVDGAGDIVDGAAGAAGDAAKAVVGGAAAKVVGSANDGMADDDNTKAINAAKSKVTWTGRAMGKSHSGTVNIKEGSIDMNGDNLVGGEFTIDMNTITATDITDEKLDTHLKADDFFDVANHSEAMLKITKVEGTSVTADMTIKGTTLPVTFDVDTSAGGASASFSIDSTKRGVQEGGIKDALVADNIDFSIDLAY